MGSLVLRSPRVESPFAHLELGELLRVAAEADVDAAAGHVGRNRDRPDPSGLGDDRCLPLVLFGIQHLVGDALLAQSIRKTLRLLDRDRANEDRLAFSVAFDEVVGECVELRILRHVHEVGLIHPAHLHVGRDLNDTELVDLVELPSLGHRGAGHTGEFLVETEVVLEGDRGERLILFLDPDAFLGLDPLVEALGVAPTLENSSGELVDDLDLTVGHHVVHVAVIESLGLERYVEVVDHVDVGVVVHVLDTEEFLDLGDPRLGGHHLALALIDLVVEFGSQTLGDTGEVAVPLRRFPNASADDERRSRLIHQDGVDLVDDGKVVSALGEIPRLHRHVVAQVVETELVVGAVGHIRGVCGSAVVRQHVALDQADGQTEETVHTAHPFGVAARQVVVHGDDVNTLPGECVEVDRHGRDERLALARLHFRNPVSVEHGGAHHLDVEVPLPEDSLCGFANDGVRLGLDIFEGLTSGEAGPEFVGLGAKRLIGEGMNRRFEGVDRSDDSLEVLELLALARAEESLQQGHGYLILEVIVERETVFRRYPLPVARYPQERLAGN